MIDFEDGIDVEDIDDDELTTVEAVPVATDDGSYFAPTFAKCPHCNEDGKVLTGLVPRTHYKSGNESSTRVYDECHECDGVGYFDVPTDEASKESLKAAGRRSDVVILMRKRFLMGLSPWTGFAMQGAT